MRPSGTWIMGLPMLLLMACGGGSSPAPTEQPISVRFDPPTISATFYGSGQSLNMVEVPISCTIVNPPSPLYAFLIQDHDILWYSKQPLFPMSPTTYGDSLRLNTALAPGTYSGALQLVLARNADGTSPYPVSGGTLPYALTVTPGITIQCKVNGVPVVLSQSSPGQPFSTSVHNGDLVQLVSSVPVMWGSSAGGARVNNQSYAETFWQANVLYGGSEPVGEGDYLLDVATFTPPQAHVMVRIVVSSN